MKLVVALGLLLLVCSFFQSCADSNFMDRTRKDESILEGTAVGDLDPVSRSVVMLTDDLVFQDYKPTFFGICTGVIIGPRTVLTAGHCLKHWSNQTRVILKTDPRKSLSSDDIYEVMDAEAHPTYLFHADLIKSSSAKETRPDLDNYNDLAIILVDRNFPKASSSLFSLEKVKEIKSPTATVAGFGKTTYNRNTEDMDYREVNGVLKQTDIPIRNSFLAQDYFESEQWQRNGVCKGDSGAPLFLKTNGHYQLLGLAIGVFSHELTDESKFDECAGVGLYQNLEKLKPWIKQAQQRLESLGDNFHKSILFKNSSLDTK